MVSMIYLSIYKRYFIDATFVTHARKTRTL